MRQECRNLRLAHCLRMALAEKEDKAFDPANIRAFGADTVMPDPDGGSDPLDKG